MKTYWILDTTSKKIKIGRSKSPEQRLKTLQTGNPNVLSLILVLDYDCEKKMHSFFRRERVSNEWFRRSKKLLKCLAFLLNETTLDFYSYILLTRTKRTKYKKPIVRQN